MHVHVFTVLTAVAMAMHMNLFCVAVTMVTVSIFVLPVTAQTTTTRQPRRVCGVRMIVPPNDYYKDQNIVGGKEAYPHSWPWMVNIMYNKTKRYLTNCGGVLIKRRWVLTAAHCLCNNTRAPKYLPERLLLRLGVHDDTIDEPMVIKVRPRSQYYIHPNYTGRTSQHDIALIKLEKKVKINDYVQPICLSKRIFPDGTNSTVIGWGWDEEELVRRGKNKHHDGERLQPVSNEYPAKLHEVSIPTMPDADCKEYYKKRILNGMMCAGLDVGGKDACSLDSGGPLMTLGENGVWKLVGIASWGNGCGGVLQPGVYTRVALYVDWIRSVVK